MTWRRFAVIWKYRFDLGWQFMALLNLTLLIISARAPLQKIFHVQKVYLLILVMLSIGFSGVLLFGLFLDKVIHYMQEYNIQHTVRNQPMLDVIDSLARIEKKLEITPEEEDWNDGGKQL